VFNHLILCGDKLILGNIYLRLNSLYLTDVLIQLILLYFSKTMSCSLQVTEGLLIISLGLSKSRLEIKQCQFMLLYHELPLILQIQHIKFELKLTQLKLCNLHLKLSDISIVLFLSEEILKLHHTDFMLVLSLLKIQFQLFLLKFEFLHLVFEQ